MVAEKITVQGTKIAIKQIGGNDFISITDMLNAKDGGFFVSDWLRNRNTVEFLGIWESIHNPAFNYGEFAIIRTQAGLNRFKMSVKEWIEKTNAIGIKATAGRYGGTYAHKDLAFEFGMWISPEFKIYLIKEFQRLKEQEQKQLEWSAKRELAKVNYLIHTGAIKDNLIVAELTKEQINYVYANEADMLNVALFGITANDWIKKNPNKKGNMRDYATVEQLLVLANLESYNAILIEQGFTQQKRIVLLHETAKNQLERITLTSDKIKRITKQLANKNDDE